MHEKTQVFHINIQNHPACHKKRTVEFPLMLSDFCIGQGQRKEFNITLSMQSLVIMPDRARVEE